MEDFDFNDTAPPPLIDQEFLMENLCIKKGKAPGSYEPPATRSSAKRWKHIHEQNMMARLNEMHIIKKQNAQMSKEAAREIIRKIPVELLAKEWLSKEDATVDMRAYLVDHILPTLILGVERLLKEVDEKGLSATNRFEPEFNPINFLAQYLMRNNPRFSNFAEASPYVRGLREVSEEIKQELFTFEDNRLARIKAETRRKRTDRETYEQQIQEEKDRRHNLLISQFKEWTDFTEQKSVELSFLQNALRSFAETIEQLPVELQEVTRFGQPLDPTDESGKTLLLKEFVEYISLFVEDLTFEVFQLFMDHMSKCAATQKASVDRENRRIILTNLFLICDYGVLRFIIPERKLGLLDRDRITNLFEHFWDQLIENNDPRGTLRNPQKWPVIEVVETDDVLFDAWENEPDGGIREDEFDKQIQLLEDIKNTLHKEIEVNATRDKVAKQIWKKEQLEQKSAGYRAKLYKYNVTDFINLIQYPLMDTIEAPLKHMDNKDARLTMSHDLYTSTLTRTARERSNKPEDNAFDVIKLPDEEMSSDIKDSKIPEETEENNSNEVNSKNDDQKQSEKESNISKKATDKNTNSRTQDLSLDETSSVESINRNNNIAGNDTRSSSSDDNEYTTSSYNKTKDKSTTRSKKRVNRIVRFSCYSEVSSEETELIPKPVKFRKSVSPLSSEDEVAWHRARSHSLPQHYMQKNKNVLAGVSQGVQTLINPVTLPPILTNKNVRQEEMICNKQISDGEGAEREESLREESVKEELVMTKDTQGGTETADNTHATGGAATTNNAYETTEAHIAADGGEAEAKLAGASATVKSETVEYEDAAEKPETLAKPEIIEEAEAKTVTEEAGTTTEKERTEEAGAITETEITGEVGAITETEITEKAKTEITEETKTEETKTEITEETKTEKTGEAKTKKTEEAKTEITEEAKTEKTEEAETTAEAKVTLEKELTTEPEMNTVQNSEMLEEQSNEKGHRDILSADKQNDELLAEEMTNEKTQYVEVKNVDESAETSKTLNTDIERSTDESAETSKTLNTDIERSTDESAETSKTLNTDIERSTDESAETSKTLNTDIERSTDESAETSKTLNIDTERSTDDTLNVIEDVKDIDKTEGEVGVPLENAKEELSFKENTEVDIMKELLASQIKLLASLTSSFDKPDTNKIGVKDNLHGVLYNDVNLNRNVGNLNVNSCLRTRQITATSTPEKLVHLSSFSESYLNLAQLVQLVETFIGPHADDKVFATLVYFITSGYQECEPEKTDRLLAARQKGFLAKKKAMLNNLFEKWDNDGSGFLELEAVSDVMSKFKEGQEVDAIRIAQSELRKQSEYHDNSLSKQEFREFINLIIEELPGNVTFDLFVEFLSNSVERSYAERIRGEARKKWIQQINMAAETSGTSMEPVYKAVFQALYKDAETHGGEKRISASIAMLETNKLEPSRGGLLLRYSACTPEDCQYMLGKPLYKNMKGVSFQAVETGKPIHVPRVASHGNVYFWNYDRMPQDRSGSFIAVPLKDKKKRVFGVLGVDTMIDSTKETIFIGHEIHFYQGVAKAFSIAYHFVERRRKFLRVLENAISWFHRRCPNITEITVYFVEPSLRVTGDYVLRKMMVKDLKGGAAYVPELVRLERKDNFFSKYLFECMESSLTIISEVREARHIACPIRDNNGITVCILDLNTENLKILPRYESKDAQRILRLLQKAYMELCNVAQGAEPNCTLEAESNPTVRADIMFERVMLQEMRDNISRLDPQAFAEIKGFFVPPRAIAETLRATIAVLKVDQVGEGEYDDWEDMRNYITIDLVQQIKTYDPIASAHLGNAEKVEKYLKTVCIAEVAEYGAIAAQQLYNWVHACLALIEYMCRKKESDG